MDDGASTSEGDRNRDSDEELEALRREVEETYDFDDFGPEDMAQMSAEEWDAAFDPDTWITGVELLDRVEAELKTRIARRDVFGVLERVREDGEPRVLVYSDEGYAIVYPSGEMTGRGSVMEDVEPVVALAAMESYEVAEPPADWSLPDPESVSSSSGDFGNKIVQVIAFAQLLAGVTLIGAWILLDVTTIVAPAAGILFVLVGIFLFAMVANARLSDRFRAEEYRERLRVLREADQRPDFVPIEPDDETDNEGKDTADR